MTTKKKIIIMIVVGIIACAAFGLYIMLNKKSSSTGKPLQSQPQEDIGGNQVTTSENQIPDMNSIGKKNQGKNAAAPGVAQPGATQPGQQPQRPQRPNISIPIETNLYTNKDTAKGPIVSDKFIPFGCLIKCRLVMTVDTGRMATPVIGEVMEEVWHQNTYGEKNMIIERGVLVHGMCSGSPMRDRIPTEGNWTLVWRNADSPDNGKELVIKGLALENSQEAGGNYWTITDGSAGIPGYAIEGSELKEIMALISTFVSGLGAGMVSTDTTTTSSSTVTSYQANMKTAVALGVQRTAELYAQRMLRKIAEDTYFVRAPAGTPFYIYVQQPLDLEKATVAGSMIDAMEKEAKMYNRLSSNAFNNNGNFNNNNNYNNNNSSSGSGMRSASGYTAPQAQFQGSR